MNRNIETARQPKDRELTEARASRKPYQSPQLIHEADLEVRAGSPLFAPGEPGSANPWDPDYGQGGQR